MANQLYNSGKQAFLTGELNWSSSSTDVYYAALIGENYPFDATHASIQDIKNLETSNSATYIIQTQILSGVTSSQNDGTALANTITFSSVSELPSGPRVGSIIIYKEAPNDSDKTLIVYIDNVDNFPVSSNGGDITVNWNGGSGEIFSL